MVINSRQCAIDGCKTVALLAGPSVVCGRALCAAHATPKWHPCLLLPWDRLAGKTCKDHSPLYDVIARIGEAPIAASALQLRPSALYASVLLPSVASAGKAHDQQYAYDLALGGCNLHVPLLFDDGTRWLVRVRVHLYDHGDGEEAEDERRGDGDEETRRAMMLSDYETVTMLHQAAPGMVPRAYMPRIRTEGLDFFFMEATNEGQLLQVASQKGGKDKTVTVREYADFLLKVASVQFTGIGSLRAGVVAPASSSVVPDGPNSNGDHDEQQSGPSTPPPTVGPKIELWPWGPPATLGPFDTNRDAYLAKINRWLSLLESAKGSARRPDRVLAYLAGLEVRALVSECEEMAESGPTYIKGNDNYNTASGGGGGGGGRGGSSSSAVGKTQGVCPFTDWESASTTPLHEAFSPFALLDWPAFFSGSNTLTPAELALADVLEHTHARPDLAAAVRGGRKYQRLRYFLDAQSVSLSNLNGLREAFEDGDGEGDSRPGTPTTPTLTAPNGAGRHARAVPSRSSSGSEGGRSSSSGKPVSIGQWAERTLPQHADNPGLQRVLRQVSRNAGASASDAAAAAAAATAAVASLRSAIALAAARPVLVDPADIEVRRERAGIDAALETAIEAADAAMVEAKRSAKVTMGCAIEGRWALDIVAAGRRAMVRLSEEEGEALNARRYAAGDGEVVLEEEAAEGAARRDPAEYELARWVRVAREIEAATTRAEAATSKAEAGAGNCEGALKEAKASRVSSGYY